MRQEMIGEQTDKVSYRADMISKKNHEIYLK